MGMDEGFMGLVAGAMALARCCCASPLASGQTALAAKSLCAGGLPDAGAVSGGLSAVLHPGGFLVARTLGGVASASWVSFTVLYSAYFPREEGQAGHPAERAQHHRPPGGLWADRPFADHV